MNFLVKSLFTLLFVFPLLLQAGIRTDELAMYQLEQKKALKKQSEKTTFYYCALSQSTPTLMDIFRELSATEALVRIYEDRKENSDELKQEAVDLRKEYNAFRKCRETIHLRYNESIFSDLGVAPPNTKQCNKRFRITCGGKEYTIGN